jgi:transposase
MRVLMLKRPEGDERTGVFTSGIVSTNQSWKIALYFTGREHAGENIADVLKRRATELPAPIRMCDALSRKLPKLAAGVEILLASCLAHGRRLFVEFAANFPASAATCCDHDAEAREQAFTPEPRWITTSSKGH